MRFNIQIWADFRRKYRSLSFGPFLFKMLRLLYFQFHNFDSPSTWLGTRLKLIVDKCKKLVIKRKIYRYSLKDISCQVFFGRIEINVLSDLDSRLVLPGPLPPLLLPQLRPDPLLTECPPRLLVTKPLLYFKLLIISIHFDISCLGWKILCCTIKRQPLKNSKEPLANSQCILVNSETSLWSTTPHSKSFRLALKYDGSSFKL